MSVGVGSPVDAGRRGQPLGSPTRPPALLDAARGFQG